MIEFNTFAEQLQLFAAAVEKDGENKNPGNQGGAKVCGRYIGFCHAACIELILLVRAYAEKARSIRLLQIFTGHES